MPRDQFSVGISEQVPFGISGAEISGIRFWKKWERKYLCDQSLERILGKVSP